MQGCGIWRVCEIRCYCVSQINPFELRFLNIFKKPYRMLHLEDLLEHNHDHHSDSKPSFNQLPELKEIKEFDQTYASFDTFFHHLGEQHLPTNCHLNNQSNTSDLPSLDDHCSSSEEKEVKKMAVRKSRNQTKNIPKNFGKGIISFLQKNRQKFKPLIESYGLDSDRFISQLKQQKSKINTIAQLRSLWTGEMGGCMRVLSNLFFRKYALEYIFNSRISSYASHIKYRASLWRALEQPETFSRIKQY